MPWLAHHNPEVDWRTVEVKITRCSKEYGKQWRPKQGKSEWQKQREEEKKEEEGKKQEKKEQRKEEGKKRRKLRRRKMIEVKQIAEEWEIWDEEGKAVKLEEEVKRLVLERFYK